MSVDQPELQSPENLILSKEKLVSKTWSFTSSSRGVVSPHCKFLISGFVSGILGHGACWWEFNANQLFLRDHTDRPTAAFDRFFMDSAGHLSLTGRSLLDADLIFILNERAAISEICEDSTDVSFISKNRQSRRRNLVVIRANETSVHPSWPIDVRTEDRNWDLCTSFYGDASSFPMNDFAEYQVLQNKNRKWPAIHKLFHRNSPLWDYDYFLFPDDDIDMSWGSINRIFDVSRRLNLHLAQPALGAGSYFSYKITLQNELFNLRYTNFIEAMIPLFSRFAMEICAPTFATSHSGWGLDYVWSYLLGNIPRSIAIIDETPVLHRRPVGNSYDTSAARAEMYRVMAQYGAPISQSAFGGLVPSGWRLISSEPVDECLSNPSDKSFR